MNLQRLTQENKNLKAQNKLLLDDLRELRENKDIILERERKKAQKELLIKISRKATDSADLFCEAVPLSDIDYLLNLITQDENKRTI